MGINTAKVHRENGTSNEPEALLMADDLEASMRGPEEARIALDADGESAEKLMRQNSRPCISRVSMRASGQIVCAS